MEGQPGRWLPPQTPQSDIKDPEKRIEYKTLLWRPALIQRQRYVGDCWGESSWQCDLASLSFSSHICEMRCYSSSTEITKIPGQSQLNGGKIAFGSRVQSLVGWLPGFQKLSQLEHLAGRVEEAAPTCQPGRRAGREMGL